MRTKICAVTVILLLIVGFGFNYLYDAAEGTVSGPLAAKQLEDSDSAAAFVVAKKVSEGGIRNGVNAGLVSLMVAIGWVAVKPRKPKSQQNQRRQS